MKAKVAVIPQKFSLPFLAGMGLFSLGVNYLWVSYSSIILPVQVQMVVPAERIGRALGVIAGIAFLGGVIANLFAGLFSDRSTNRFGRRSPILFAGTVLAFPAILLGVLFPITLPIVFASYLGVQIFSYLAYGAYYPLLADIVPGEQRGLASGFIGFLTLGGTAMSFAIITTLITANHLSWALWSVALVFIICSYFSLYVINPYDLPAPRQARMGFGMALGEVFRIKPGSAPFFWFVLASLLISIALGGFQFYGLYYLQTVLKVSNPMRALQTTGLVTLIISMLAAVTFGIISDKTGRRRWIIIASGLAGICVLTFPFLTSFKVFIGMGVLFAAAIGIVLSVRTAMAASLAPEDQAGKYLAYDNLSQTLSNAIAAPLFGTILNLEGAPTIHSFTILFIVVASLFFIGSILFIIRVPRI